MDELLALWPRGGAVAVDCIRSPEAFRDFFKSNYGPTVVAYHVSKTTLGRSPPSRPTSSDWHVYTIEAPTAQSWTGSTYWSPHADANYRR